ncbi:MAG TPA: hypothetical protein VGS61_08330, partial [Acidimicrobiales bacterium]|nr:hypothetical protein [Acidimicrobiales bacterium]
MARARPRASTVLAAVILVAGVALAAVDVARERSPASGPASTTTTSSVPRERPQSGWAVVSSSARGVMVDTETVVVAGARFRVLRLRARTTLLRWHVGLSDPVDYARAPADAGPSIDWATEGPPGVVAVFNGGFKQNARAGGEMADGVTLVAPVAGDATIALDAAGHWAMGVWGAPGFPPAGFDPISYRQNLRLLVDAGRPTALASAPFR